MGKAIDENVYEKPIERIFERMFKKTIVRMKTTQLNPGFSRGMVLCAALLLTTCGDAGEMASGVDPAPAAPRAATAVTQLPLLGYLDLQSDQVTGAAVDRQTALETARNQLLAETGGAEDYEINIPSGWFNAERHVFVFVWRLRGDRVTGGAPPERGYLAVLNATTGAILAAGPYQR
jgi:hypothetical protein